MHYRVTYLAIDEREMLLLHAPDAATAVAMAAQVFDGAPHAFELLSMTPEPETSATGDLSPTSTDLVR